jgi:hypothetical protein
MTGVSGGGAYRLLPVNDVAHRCMPAEGIVLWHGKYLLGRTATEQDGFAFPANLSQLSSRHCTFTPSEVEVRASDLQSASAARAVVHNIVGSVPRRAQRRFAIHINTCSSE